jgi:hypothetical protein
MTSGYTKFGNTVSLLPSAAKIEISLGKSNTTLPSPTTAATME